MARLTPPRPTVPPASSAVADSQRGSIFASSRGGIRQNPLGPRRRRLSSTAHRRGSAHAPRWRVDKRSSAGSQGPCTSSFAQPIPLITAFNGAVFYNRHRPVWGLPTVARGATYLVEITGRPFTTFAVAGHGAVLGTSAPRLVHATGYWLGWLIGSLAWDRIDDRRLRDSRTAHDPGLGTVALTP